MQPHYEWDGLYYTGFWWRSLGSLGRIVRPTIHLKLTADASNVAHEAGHYFTHVLVGDDTWSVLEGQAPLWDTGHGPRDVVGREVLLEDYAYWSEWLLIGSVKSYDLHDPYVIFGGLSPLTVDFPSLEGFGAVMLASLTRTTPEMRHLINGRLTDVPVLGFTNAQVYDLIAQGATGIESLREHIATAAGTTYLPFARFSLAPVLLSPWRGLLTWSPVTAVAIAGWVRLALTPRAAAGWSSTRSGTCPTRAN